MALRARRRGAGKDRDRLAREPRGQARIKAARLPARKTLEEFDFAFQTSLKRETVLSLGQLDFLAGNETVVLLGPPGTGKTHLSISLGIASAWPATGSPSAPRPNGSRRPPTPSATAAEIVEGPRWLYGRGGGTGGVGANWNIYPDTGTVNVALTMQYDLRLWDAFAALAEELLFAPRRAARCAPVRA